jgi:hypothetical protein
VEITAERVIASAGVAAVVASLIGNWLAWREAKSARDAASTAERHLLEERKLAARRNRALIELERVRTLAERHAALQNQNIVLSPLENGLIIVALDALPADRLPLARQQYHPTRRATPSDMSHQEQWEHVRVELETELRLLVSEAAGEADMED